MSRITRILPILLLLAGCSRSPEDYPADRDKRGVRVASLAPSITEIICAIGGTPKLVGRSSACDYPPEIAGEIPVIGHFGRPSLEALLASDTTLVLDSALADESMARKMQQVGLQSRRIDCKKLDDIPSAIREIGSLLDLEENAEALAAGIEKDLQELRSRSNTTAGRPGVYIETWNDPLWTTGNNTHLSEMIHLAGGRNIADDIEKEHFQVSPEWVVARNPDIIICLYMARKDKVKSSVMKRTGWKSVNAVKNKRVYDGFDNDIMLRPGPRIIQGIEIIRKCITGRNEN